MVHKPTNRQKDIARMLRNRRSRWLAEVTRRRNAPHLKPGVFTRNDPRRIARPLKHSTSRTMARNEFEKLVREVIRSLPKRFKDKLQNIDFVIEERSREKDLLGLYEGVPVGERTHDCGVVLPDKITLFKRNIEAESKANGTSLLEEIRHTIEHEIAHHFGMTDEELEEKEID